MTIDEAIVHAREVATIQRNNKKLNDTLGPFSPYYNQDCVKCAQEHGQLAEWLEELKQYRAIGTPEECRVAVEKQHADKPLYQGYVYVCPSCNSRVTMGSKFIRPGTKFCEDCGQKLDWSDVE